MNPQDPDKMRGAVRLGSMAGIGIYVHWSFLLLIGWVVWVNLSAGSTISAAAEDVGFVLTIFGCVVLHELGHALMARRFGIGTRHITLLPIGGVASLERIPEKPMQEFWVAVAGPAVNIVIAAALLGIVAATDRIAAPSSMLLAGGNFLTRLMWVNVFLVVFNMIPAFPMDGGRVLRALLALVMEYVQATRIAARVGQGFAVLFGIVGLLYNPFLLIIAVFIFFAGMQEVRAVSFRAAVRGALTRDLMVTRFLAFSPDHPLHAASEAMQPGTQHDFPVVDADGRPRGMLLRDDILRLMATGEHDRRIGDVMRGGDLTVEESTTLEDAFMRMRQGGVSSLAVVRDNRLIGIILLEHIGRFLAMRTAVSQHVHEATS